MTFPCRCLLFPSQHPDASPIIHSPPGLLQITLTGLPTSTPAHLQSNFSIAIRQSFNNLNQIMFSLLLKTLQWPPISLRIKMQNILTMAYKTLHMTHPSPWSPLWSHVLPLCPSFTDLATITCSCWNSLETCVCLRATTLIISSVWHILPPEIKWLAPLHVSLCSNVTFQWNLPFKWGHHI